MAFGILGERFRGIMFLLTGEEIAHNVGDGWVESVGSKFVDVAQAQLKKVVEVGDEPCSVHGGYITNRWVCPVCFPYLIQQLREEALGEASGETLSEAIGETFW